MRAGNGRVTALCSVAAALAWVGTSFHPAVVVGDSMAPALRDGRLILVDRLYYRTHVPLPGEVVLFRHEGQTYVKRVYAGPGERMHVLTHDGEFMGLMGEPHASRYRARLRPRQPYRVEEWSVPPDMVYVLGDNYPNSQDSREFGFVPLRNVVGRARVEVDRTATRNYEVGAALRRAARHSARPDS
jgi:signal peptidase I